MTTPSSGTVAVLGVLVDTTISCQVNVPPDETVHEAVESLWTTIGERVDENFTSETTKPSVTLVLSGEIDPAHLLTSKC